MPKENRFAGLGEAMESESESDAEPNDEQPPGEDTPDGSEKSESEPAVEPKSEGDAAPDSNPEAASESDETSESDDAGESSGTAESSERDEPGEPAESTAEEDGPESIDETEQTTEAAGGPAFEFEATTAKSIYVRTATLDRLDDAEFEVESHLRREHDVRDLTGREFHDALVRVAAEYPEKIADAVLETREE
ncbi:hypothetical protein [Haloferax sp. Q22]|uniref:hypothetical protein n=1 Tax=Haloferax sp. (strain Q22) TaxID=1526048 RepID=UPI000737B808|nr:hypothetical protein [Haloferax sp. Q22]